MGGRLKEWKMLATALISYNFLRKNYFVFYETGTSGYLRIYLLGFYYFFVYCGNLHMSLMSYKKCCFYFKYSVIYIFA